MNFLQKVRLKSDKKESGFFWMSFEEDGEDEAYIVHPDGDTQTKLSNLEPCKPTIREYAMFMGAKWYFYQIDKHYGDKNYYATLKKPNKTKYEFSTFDFIDIPSRYVDCSELENVPWQDSLREV